MAAFNTRIVTHCIIIIVHRHPSHNHSPALLRGLATLRIIQGPLSLLHFLLDLRIIQQLLRIVDLPSQHLNFSRKFIYIRSFVSSMLQGT